MNETVVMEVESPEVETEESIEDQADRIKDWIESVKKMFREEPQSAESAEEKFFSGSPEEVLAKMETFKNDLETGIEQIKAGQTCPCGRPRVFCNLGDVTSFYDSLGDA